MSDYLYVKGSRSIYAIVKVPVKPDNLSPEISDLTGFQSNFRQIEAKKPEFCRILRDYVKTCQVSYELSGSG